jgi:hypothetical protein
MWFIIQDEPDKVDANNSQADIQPIDRHLSGRGTRRKRRRGIQLTTLLMYTSGFVRTGVKLTKESR